MSDYTRAEKLMEHRTEKEDKKELLSNSSQNNPENNQSRQGIKMYSEYNTCDNSRDF